MMHHEYVSCIVWTQLESRADLILVITGATTTIVTMLIMVNGTKKRMPDRNQKDSGPVLEGVGTDEIGITHIGVFLIDVYALYRPIHAMK